MSQNSVQYRGGSWENKNVRIELQEYYMALSEEQIRDYLANNPNFLVDNADLLHALTPPAYQAGGNIVDFQRYMVERLQEDVERLDQYQDALIAASRSNLASQQQVHTALLAAMDASNLDHLIHTVTNDWVDMLNVDAIALCLEGDDPTSFPATIQWIEPGKIAQLMGQEGAILLRDHLTAASKDIFGPAAPLVRAEALVKLAPGTNRPSGILAMGSRDPDYYTPGQGTELLRFMGAAMERLLDQWLNTRPPVYRTKELSGN